MDWLKLIEGLGGGLYMAVITFVGIRLLFLARRNRKLPELLLGVAFLLGGTFGGSFEMLGRRLPGLSIEVAGGLLLLGKIFAGLGMNAYNFFIWRVFRPDGSWARLLFFALLALTVGTMLGQAWDGVFTGGPQFSRFFWIEFVTRMASPVWLAFEAFRYAAQMRKRLALGLADPVVADRFRLWAFGASCSVLTLTTTLAPVFFPATHPINSFNIVLLGLTGIASCFFYWMTFFPTSAYLDRVRARAGVVTSE